MQKIEIDESAGAMHWHGGRQHLVVQAWGPHSVRVRAAVVPNLADERFALLDPTPSTVSISQNADGDAVMTNGALTVRLSVKGQLRFEKSGDGRLLLDEPAVGWLSSRSFSPVGDDAFEIKQTFAAQAGEQFFGLGQRGHGLLDQKGCTLDLLQHNTHINVPFMLSSRGYGFLWNNPAVGRVELAVNRTQWSARMSRCIDYWFTTADDYPGIYENYGHATGFAPEMPHWATGFWQCKLRYQNQEELLGVAREFKRRNIPLSVIVIDYFHWTKMGEWKFDTAHWPDPAAMVRELESMGVKLMVSVWPTVNPDAEDFAEMESRGLLIGSEHGVEVQRWFEDVGDPRRIYLPFIDSTNPRAREFLWQKIRDGYHRHGIKTFWLDADEPEIHPVDFANLRLHAGSGNRVANLYPMEHCRAFYDGLRSEGENEIVTLTRSTWAGGQRYGSVVWSGDIHSTFEEFARQIRAGLNMQLAGIPWWTTDIGGFSGGDVNDEGFRELLVRWFQWAVFCPVFRLHGVRKPESIKSGGPNEPWSFGDKAYEIIVEQIRLREKLRPYVLAQMQAAHHRGTPPMRPMFFDFPDDAQCRTLDDQFMFGPDLLIAPVAQRGQRERSVYLPAGPRWINRTTGQLHDGGQRITVATPLDSIGVFVREGSDVTETGIVAG